MEKYPFPDFHLHKPELSAKIKDDKRRASCKHKWSKDSPLDRVEQLARMHDALRFSLDLHMDKWDIRQPWEYYSDELYEKPANNPSHAYRDWFLTPCLSPDERAENRRNLAAVTPALV